MIHNLPWFVFRSKMFGGGGGGGGGSTPRTHILLFCKILYTGQGFLTETDPMMVTV